MREVLSWDKYFFEIAKTYALRSKDPRRQIGCVIVEPESRTIRSGGYNGMTYGVRETEARWRQPAKDDYVCHAEFNAVALAARNGQSTNNCEAFITRFPCLVCTRLLIQAGIRMIWVPPHTTGVDNQEEYNRVLRLIVEANIPFMHSVTFVKSE